MGGQRLRIDELSMKYGVSNTPIRDAFRRLASLGFVENIPRRMVIVREISLKEIEDIYVIQSVLEGIAADLAVRLCSDEDVESLARLHCRLEECVPRGDADGYSAADVEFHALFLRLCQNVRLFRWSRTPAITSPDSASSCFAIPAVLKSPSRSIGGSSSPSALGMPTPQTVSEESHPCLGRALEADHWPEGGARCLGERRNQAGCAAIGVKGGGACFP